MHYRRRKPRREVRCPMCTDARNGNTDKGDGKQAGRHRRWKVMERDGEKDEDSSSQPGP